jgi:hypothetical protein
MADFARRASEEFSKDQASPTATDATTPAAPLAAQALLWTVIKAYWSKFVHTLGLARS